MEVYALSWVPSPSPQALIAKQQVLAVIGTEAETPLTPNGTSSPDLAVGLATAEFTFDTDAQVSFVVATFGADGSVVRSDPFAFVAADHEAISPATGFSVKWVSHVVGQG